MSDHIGPYRLDEELGRGAMGIVYRGFDPAIGRTVAIKVIRTQQFSASELAELNVRFAREAAAAGKLAHPNIVIIYQLGQESGAQYMAMEFVAGTSLEHSLPAGTSMETATAVSILSQIADALDYAHGEGVVHRDIKPANVIVRPDGRIKITDFGIARIAAQTMTQTGITMGTPSYMAPEQILGSRVDGKADQFSLAIIAYRMLSGRKPFDADSSQAILYQTVHAQPPSLDVINADLPPACATVVQRALAKDPAQRYPTCLAFIQDLKASFALKPVKPPVEHHPLIPKVAGPPPRQHVLSWRTIGIAAAAGAMLAVFIAGLVYYSSRPSRAPAASETRPQAQAAVVVRPAETNPAPSTPDGGARGEPAAPDLIAVAPPAPVRAKPAKDPSGTKRESPPLAVKEGTIAEAKASAVEVSSPQTARLAEIDREIERLQMTLSVLRRRYTDAHPQVRGVLAEITDARARRADILNGEGPQHVDSGATTSQKGSQGKPVQSQPTSVDRQDQVPRLIKWVEPIYPPLAKQAHISGTVRFRAIIRTDGTVQNLATVSGHPLLIDAARTAVSQWVFQPTLSNNEPVSVNKVLDVNFLLDGISPSDTPPTTGVLYLQLAAIPSQNDADAILESLHQKGFEAIKSFVPEMRQAIVRVLVGPVTEGKENETREKLTSAGFSGDSAIKRVF